VTPLHVAIAGADERRKEGSLNKQEFLRVVDILLENNANLDAEDSNGNTPKDYMSGLKGFEQINLEDRQSELVQKKNLLAV
jgi:ankyrin repeat protein